MEVREPLVVGVLHLKIGGIERDPIRLHAGDAIRIGRELANDLVLDDNLVSRFHAVFNASGAGIVLTDLSSLNGTFLNGRRVTTPMVLRPGNVVSIGANEITVHPGEPREDESDELLESFSQSPKGTLVAEMKSVVITILLADVCSYTKFSEQLSPTDVATTLQTWFRVVSETVESFGGQIDKYIGDCVMALWCGAAPDARKLAMHASDCALAIQRRTDELSASGDWPYHEHNPWRCRISLNSGEALMGTLASARLRDFTVLGDAVNVAFRLNDLAGKINQNNVISAETAGMIKDAFVVEALGDVPIEGRKGRVEIYQLVAKKEGASELPDLPSGRPLRR